MVLIGNAIYASLHELGCVVADEQREFRIHNHTQAPHKICCSLLWGFLGALWLTHFLDLYFVQ